MLSLLKWGSHGNHALTNHPILLWHTSVHQETQMITLKGSCQGYHIVPEKIGILTPATDESKLYDSPDVHIHVHVLYT